MQQLQATLLFVVCCLFHSKLHVNIHNFNSIEVKTAMAPKSQPDEADSTPKTSTMKRSDSESSFVGGPEEGPVKDYRDYRVRKSSLIA